MNRHLSCYAFDNVFAAVISIVTGLSLYVIRDIFTSLTTGSIELSSLQKEEIRKHFSLLNIIKKSCKMSLSIKIKWKSLLCRSKYGWQEKIKCYFLLLPVTRQPIDLFLINIIKRS